MSKTWKDISVRRDANLKEALTVLDRGAMQIALVVDDECHLAGTITDGDARRALLANHETPKGILAVPHKDPARDRALRAVFGPQPER